MEDYYKERQKQQTKYSKMIKKMAESKDPRLSQVKKEYANWSIKPPTFDRGEYWPEQDVIKEISKRIREAEEEFTTLKYDLCYDLSTDLDSYEPLEKKIAKLKKTRDRLLIEKQKREVAVLENKKRLNALLRGKIESYPYLDLEAKKETYNEIKELNSQLINPSRQVIAYEIEHKELEYRLTQLYEPLTLIKIS